MKPIFVKFRQGERSIVLNICDILKIKSTKKYWLFGQTVASIEYSDGIETVDHSVEDVLHLIRGFLQRAS